MTIGGVLLAVGGVLLGFPDLIRIGLGCVAMTSLALVVATRRRPRLQVRRALSPAPLISGQPGRVEVTLSNAGPRSSDPVAAAEQVSTWLGTTTRLVLPRISAGGRTTVDYEVCPRRRGRHRAGPLTLIARDPLGLTHRTVIIGDCLEVLVLPSVHDLTGNDPAGRGLGHEGEAPSTVLSGSERDVSVREYRQGDDLRRVHWGVTAHRGRLMVRHEAQPRLRRAVLVFDASPRSWGVPHGGDAGSGFEWAVEAVASVAAHLAKLDFSLHLLMVGARPSGSTRIADPARALALPDLLACLADVEPADGISPAGKRIHGTGMPDGGRPGWSPPDLADASVAATARDVAGAGGMVILVTGDGMTDQEDETVVAADRFGILRTGLTGMAMVVDTASFGRVDRSVRDWWVPGSADSLTADPQVGAGTAGAQRSRRLCAYARSGGWRAVNVIPSMTPALAWSRLLRGSPGQDNSLPEVYR
ncbi:hypothetical protein KEM60_00601 [Austwickia sp. TVS 96-490-7B]|nr:hypothetical protein [Austwickia sp. TVS 96-490-7B]